MLLNLFICNLMTYGSFVYWPQREIDDCLEPIKDGKSEDAKLFTVFGQRYEPSKNAEVEDPIADFSTLAEAATYCLMLNAALQGRTVEFDKPEEKEEKDASESF